MNVNYRSLFDIEFLLNNNYITLGQFEELQDLKSNVLLKLVDNEVDKTMLSKEYKEYVAKEN